MDRFIGGYELREDYTYFALKSNMDRFIDALPSQRVSVNLL